MNRTQKSVTLQQFHNAYMYTDNEPLSWNVQQILHVY